MNYWHGDIGLGHVYGETDGAKPAARYGNNYIWGDHGYGTNSFEKDEDRTDEIDYYYEDGTFDPKANFLDFERNHLMDELSGDDDVIIGGYGTARYGEWIWGGDGDDDITTGYGWGDGRTFGNDGNDTIFVRDTVSP